MRQTVVGNERTTLWTAGGCSQRDLSSRARRWLTSSGKTLVTVREMAGVLSVEQ
jgi:hypothetical protein